MSGVARAGAAASCASDRPRAPVLVTGATGFIGRHVVARLETLGIPVVGIGRHGAGASSGRACAHAVDLCRDDAVEKLLAATDGCLGVVHLAASVPDAASAADDEELFVRITTIDRAVTEVCRTRSWPLVYASSAALYDFRSPGRRSERSAVSPTTAYARAKAAGEELVEQLDHSGAAPSCALRIAAPFGPGWRRETVVTTFVRAALASRPLRYDGTGSRAQDFVYVEDVADACVRALRANASGTFNVGSGVPVTTRELAAAIVEVAGTRGSVVEPSGRPDLQEGLVVDLDVSHAAAELGWRATTPLAQGLGRTIAAARGREA